MLGCYEPLEDENKVKRLPAEAWTARFSSSIFVWKSYDNSYIFHQQLAEVLGTTGKVGGDQIAIKSLGRDHGGVIAVVVIAVVVAL